MIVAPAYFVHIGHGYWLNAQRVLSVIRPETAQAKRIKKDSVALGKFIDYTHGKATKCYVILEDFTVIACGLTGGTICNRLNSALAPLNSDASDDEGEGD